MGHRKWVNENCYTQSLVNIFAVVYELTLRKKTTHLRYVSSNDFRYEAPIDSSTQEMPASVHSDAKMSGSTCTSRSWSTTKVFSRNTSSILASIPFSFSSTGICLQMISLKACATYFFDVSSLTVWAAWATTEFGITYARSSFLVTCSLTASDTLWTIQVAKKNSRRNKTSQSYDIWIPKKDPKRKGHNNSAVPKDKDAAQICASTIERTSLHTNKINIYYTTFRRHILVSLLLHFLCCLSKRRKKRVELHSSSMNTVATNLL